MATLTHSLSRSLLVARSFINMRLNERFEIKHFSSELTINHQM